jgi:hypothetical protein
MYERKHQKLIPFPRFIRRVAGCFLLAFGIVAVALFLGMAGYHYIDGLPWIDAELNASMILTGMGPVDPMRTNAAKLFASVYALFSGVVFLSSIGIVFSPVFHRIIHKFHLDTKEDDEDDRKS